MHERRFLDSIGIPSIIKRLSQMIGPAVRANRVRAAGFGTGMCMQKRSGTCGVQRRMRRVVEQANFRSHESSRLSVLMGDGERP